MQLDLGAEEPTLLQTAKAQHRKELANWQPSEVGNPFELSQRISKDLGMKKGSWQIKGSGKGNRQCSLLCEWLQWLDASRTIEKPVTEKREIWAPVQGY